ncbi:histidine kinase [Desulfosporosinus acidiphilus SJ4]|uniref:histidine kinase n=1 Tax=Desulfosporosinus acidiphilus (strain DSM 22704 / JCM 16185 / SJ4) TaxID=646529 RepID=I4D1S5_DESAJ|nr:ATP-binding protein [Desulfosporosinus acidiphilus]AFM39749.1 histidine kinase [Desulfosporosinus acidiphilus SJ4]
MFRELRLKLTLINVGIMALLLLFFIIGTFLVMKIQVFNQSQQLMQIVANEAGSGTIVNPREHDKHLAKYFYIKTDNAGTITDSSSALPMTLDQLTPLVNMAFHKPNPQGELELHDETYSYLKVPLKETPGFIIIFVDLERDKDILQELLLSLTVGGFICLGLAYYGSRFMADRAMAPIKSSWQRQQEFVADASHELRTPLSVVQLNLDIVKGNPEETVASQSKWIDYSLLEIRRMSKLVDDLLFLARADSQQQTLNPQMFSLKTALSEVIESFTPLAQTNGISLEASFREEGMYYGDENRIKQLIVILLDNALKYTRPGGMVTLRFQDWSTHAEITVSDTGEGIEQEHLNQIFERFYRVDRARSQQKEGTGLGLAIADWIIKSHRGRIKVTSSPGKGTTFVINLPHGNLDKL